MEQKAVGNDIQTEPAVVELIMFYVQNNLHFY